MEKASAIAVGAFFFGVWSNLVVVTDPTQSAPVSRAGILVNVAAFVVITAGLKAASDLVVLILAALFLAIAVAPPIFFLQRKGVPFVLGLVLVMSALIGMLFGIGSLVASSLAQLRDQLPLYESLMRGHYQSLTLWLQQFGVRAELENQLSELANPARAFDLAANIFTGLGGVVANGFVVFILVLFLLLEASTLPNKMRAAFGDRGIHLNRFEQLFESINRYLVMKTWLSLLTGILAGLLCAVVGVDFPVLWGLLAFLFNYVPNVGSIVAAVPPMLLAMLQMGGGAALIIAGGYALINNLLGNIVEPRVMGHGLGLSPFVVLLSLVFWGWVLGPIGMLLSIPLTMGVKIAMESGKETSWIAVLLGEREASPPTEEA